MPNGLDYDLMRMNYKDFTFLNIWIILISDFILYMTLALVLSNWHEIKVYLSRTFKKNVEINVAFSRKDSLIKNLMKILF
jgi:hypothetical protein